MGLLLDLLTSENFRRRPWMYVGVVRFDELLVFLRGYEFAQYQAAPNQPAELDGFREWLHMKLDAPGNIDWQSIVHSACDNPDHAMERFFQLLDQFRGDVASRGLEKILDERLQYEIGRYGFPASSRFGERNVI
jgi:hypothetical protein